jgi:tetratricopeptide (TPR) repeat protein
MVRAVLYLFDYRFDEGQRELEQALSINPNNLTALYWLAACYKLLGAPEKALPVYDEFSLRTTGRGGGVRNALQDWGDALLMLARWNDAIAKLQEAQTLRASPSTSGGLAVALIQSGKVEAAKQQFDIFKQSRTASGAPFTISSFRTADSQLSPSPGYLKLRDSTVYDGYRKLGVPEE